jgi:mannose-1-phosphate guanylyltransferase
MYDQPFIDAEAKNRCAIVLAAGEGTRLRSFIRKIRGDTLPKQYVKFFGERSMLEMTFQRTRKLIPERRLFAVVSESHFDYTEVARQLAGYPQVQVAIQPVNRDTAIGLLLPLAHLCTRYPDSTVVVVPSDHFISEEDLFMAHVEQAFGVVEQDPSKIILLGVAPTTTEPEYGYIVPRDEAGNTFPCGVREVGRFVEKPEPTVARALTARGGLWNTMVMVFKPKTLLEHVRRISPQLYSCFARICNAIGTLDFLDVVRQVYVQVDPINLSKGFLETLAMCLPSPLLVLPVRNVQWIDCGSEDRILNVLKGNENLQNSGENCRYAS